MSGECWHRSRSGIARCCLSTSTIAALWNLFQMMDLTSIASISIAPGRERVVHSRSLHVVAELTATIAECDCGEFRTTCVSVSGYSSALSEPTGRSIPTSQSTAMHVYNPKSLPTLTSPHQIFDVSEYDRHVHINHATMTSLHQKPQHITRTH